MRLICFDLGLKMGWAVTGKKCGTINLKEKRHESHSIRFLNMKKVLADLFDEYGPFDLVAFEEVGFTSTTYAAQAYGGYVAILMSFCEERNIPYRAIPVGTIKKHATGKGNSPKSKMIFAAELMGYYPVDDNAADAACIYDYIEKHYKNVDF